jgi:tRNA-Thr(GGU) m(6)t(6)A37 methyltransferase TsaA
MSRLPPATTSREPREGEQRASIDPAQMPGDAKLVFIGRIRSPWKTRSECPKNMANAREARPRGCQLQVDPPWRPALTGIAAGDFVHVLYWMFEARRDLVIQNPRHRSGPTGTFSLRSPVRPNPVALALVQVTDIDPESGAVGIDATDALDGTPLLDIKPYLPRVDAPPAAT